MSTHVISNRRQFLSGAAAGGSLLLTACANAPSGTSTKEETAGKEEAENEEEEVSPAEDLMREHGVLKRALLIYREGITRIDSKQELPPEALMGSANLIQNFIEAYHEKLEEEQLFPRFRKAGTLVELVDVLELQHQKGRDLTGTIQRLATADALKSASSRSELRNALHSFVRMYEPHEAREDTVLFPALKKIISPNEYAALGEDFEKKEHELFGEEGFEKNVEEVARLEKLLGIYDLAEFTP
jgi:hemerythrin-like domain-containing protein